ncbi:MAG: hypothetical protein IKB38_01705 [Clostridia bacterium]|nr:hypothetical protein [Clostridia bacterium]
MFRFENGARVVFFGDSITANGTWMRRILQYYRENTDLRFEMYNAGVPGDNASAAQGRIYETVLPFDPTDVVIMFGMNDVGRNYYGVPLTGDCVIERRAMIDKSIISIKSIINNLRSLGIRVILCSPTPYDELSDIKEINRIGVEAALFELGERLKVYAKENDIPFIDFNSAMLEILKKLSKTNKSCIGPDRVHPTPAGHELMAALFLAAQGFDVEIPRTYEKMCTLAEQPFDEWENKRYALEKKVVNGSFVDRCLYHGVKNSDNIRQIIRDFPKEMRTPFMEEQFRAFDERDLHYTENIKALIAHTKSTL